MSKHGYKLRTKNRKAVEEASYGTYVWQCEDGEYLGDSEGRFLSIFAMKGDREAIRKIAEVAKSYGYADGQAVFWSGKRKISDEEYDEQVARQKAGLVADPLDFGALKDEYDAKRRQG